MQCNKGIIHATPIIIIVTLAPEPKVDEVYTKVICSPGLICTDHTNMFLVGFKVSKLLNSSL